MAFVDELVIAARAGRGGDGVVRWLHLKGKEYSGPAGGNGGDGGDVYIRGVRDINLLARYRGEKRFEAQPGNDGENRGKYGHRGKDIIVDLPIGSVVTNRETREVHELIAEGEQKLVLRGGRGGAGNAVFKSSVNRTPVEFTQGAPGEEAELYIELRLIADAGLMGLPNAGKTSLLNALTGASGKIGAYAFTTLDPNLGMLYGYVLADIPGLIEGAAEGRGLGFKFLRHIARTKLLVHCVSLESDDPLGDYQVVREEMSRFEPARPDDSSRPGGEGVLAGKEEMLVFTKSDTRMPKEIQKVQKEFKTKFKKDSVIVSVLDDISVENLKTALVAALR